MNINDFDRLFRRSISQKSDGSATVRLELGRIDARRVRKLTHVSIENKTIAYTKCRLGIKNAGIDHYLDELQNIAADELAVSRSDIILGEGDIFFAELTGTTSGDDLIMTCVGWEMKI